MQRPPEEIHARMSRGWLESYRASCAKWPGCIRPAAQADLSRTLTTGKGVLETIEENVENRVSDLVDGMGEGAQASRSSGPPCTLHSAATSELLLSLIVYYSNNFQVVERHDISYLDK